MNGPFSQLPDLSRVNVIGTSGSGKTTFSKKLATVLNVPHIELDQLYWLPNWQESTESELRDKLKRTLSQSDRWVLDGNYMSKTEDIKWKDVTTVIWVDFSFSRTLRQAIGRAFNRAITQKEIWPGTGNKESFRKTLFSHDSIVLWTITNYYPVRKRYLQKMQDPKHSEITFIRITHPRESDELIRAIETSREMKPANDSGNATKSNHSGE